MLGHDILGALPELRAHAESLMLDYGRAERPTGEPTYVDQEYVQGYEVLFYSKAKVQSRALAVEVEEVGERTATTVRLQLHLPADTDPLTVGDVWEVTAVHALSTAVVTARYRVTAPVGKTLATARRYEVEEIAS